MIKRATGRLGFIQFILYVLYRLLNDVCSRRLCLLNEIMYVKNLEHKENRYKSFYFPFIYFYLFCKIRQG